MPLQQVIDEKFAHRHGVSDDLDFETVTNIIATRKKEKIGKQSS